MDGGKNVNISDHNRLQEKAPKDQKRRITKEDMKQRLLTLAGVGGSATVIVALLGTCSGS